jgi:energy-coupling factor transport system ATP-binding protein
MENIIQVENLIFDYIRETETDETMVRAIEDISLSIEKGSFTAVIGKNGSGKSTLAKNLNGLYLPTRGRVFVNGWDTTDEEHIWDIRQTAGMVFQNPDNQLVASIVEDDIAFGPENLGVDPEEIRERIDHVLNSVGMEDYRKTAPHNLSGGQKQRIAIAGVVAMNPECIIFDEPTAMLDPKGRKDILNIILDLHKKGKTIILITHFMDEAVEADRIIIMNDGKIFLDGTPEEVFSQQEKIRSVNLDVPMAVELAERLRKRGIDVPDDIITADKLVEFICQYK